jgi:hypothetical protein
MALPHHRHWWSVEKGHTMDCTALRALALGRNPMIGRSLFLDGNSVVCTSVSNAFDIVLTAHNTRTYDKFLEFRVPLLGTLEVLTAEEFASGSGPWSQGHGAFSDAAFNVCDLLPVDRLCRASNIRAPKLQSLHLKNCRAASCIETKRWSDLVALSPAFLRRTPSMAP